MIEHDWQTIIGHCPANEVWSIIPGVSEKYELSNTGRIRSRFLCEGNSAHQHYRLLKLDGGSIRLCGKKYNIAELMSLVYGITCCPDKPGEIWKDVVGYEDLYEVSNLGRIRSKESYCRSRNGVQRYNKARIIKPCIINTGYERIVFHRDGVTQYALVHRIVAEHFLANPFNHCEVNHKNENKLDNRVENLEWCSHLYNSNYGTLQERRIRTRLENNNGKYGYKRRSSRNAGIEE